MSYKIELPSSLTEQRIQNVFHIDRLRVHKPNDDEQFPNCNVSSFYNFGDNPKTEYFVDEITQHRRRDEHLELFIRWSLCDSSWEMYNKNTKDLQALDEYLAIQGVELLEDLPLSPDNVVIDQWITHPLQTKTRHPCKA